MQSFVSSLPFVGMVITLLSVIFVGVVACKVLLSGVRRQREQQVRWYHQSRIVVGIVALVTSIAQLPNAIVPVYAQRLGLSFSTKTLFNFMANGSLILLSFILIVLYAKFLYDLRRRQSGNPDRLDEEI